MLNKYLNRCDKIALIMFYILMADVCIFGAGKLISVGSLSFRMILLGLTGLVALPVIIKNFSYLMKSKYTWVVGGFCVWLVFSTVLGVKNQNTTSLIISDLKGFCYFALFPIATCLIRTRHRAEVLSKVMMYSSAVMAIMHIVCVIWYLVSPESLTSYADHAYDIHFFYISYRISPTNVRISFLSLVCLLLGCALSVYYQIKEKNTWKQYLYMLITGVCLLAIWLSYTRSIYLAAAIAAFGTVIVFFIRTERNEKTRLFAHLCGSIVVFFAIISAFRIGTGDDYFRYGLNRALIGTDVAGILQEFTDPADTSKPGDKPTVDAATDETTQTESETTEEPGPEETTQVELDGLMTTTITSDNLRERTVSDLIANIRKSPVFGLGLGATIASRPSGLNEYFFLDLCSKTGLIGLCLYLASIVFMGWDLVKLLKSKNDRFHLSAIWLVVILGFVAYSYFTPCMNSSVGIMCYCCAMAVFQQASTTLATKN